MSRRPRKPPPPFDEEAAAKILEAFRAGRGIHAALAEARVSWRRFMTWLRASRSGRPEAARERALFEEVFALMRTQRPPFRAPGVEVRGPTSTPDSGP